MTVRQVLSASYAHLVGEIGLKAADGLLTPEEPAGGPDDHRLRADENRRTLAELSEIVRMPRVGSG